MSARTEVAPGVHVLECSGEQAAQLIRQAAKAGPRRFDGSSITGFGPLEPEQIAAGIREMRDPTHEQLQGFIGALAYRLELMDKSGHYDGIDIVLQDLDNAYENLDGIVYHIHGREEE